MTRYHFATSRPGQDALTRNLLRTGAPQRAAGRDRDVVASGAPYRHAHPADPVRMAHEVMPEPLPANRSRIAPDLLAIAVILLVVLAASLAGVRL